MLVFVLIILSLCFIISLTTLIQAIEENESIWVVLILLFSLNIILAIVFTSISI